VDETKFPANYHWPTDTPDNLRWESVEAAAAVAEAYVRRG
jgi:predicted RNA-binding protein with PUA-like domain